MISPSGRFGKRIKGYEQIKEQQRFRLRDLLTYNLRTVRAYLLKEDSQQFWEYNSPTGPGTSWTSSTGRLCVPRSSLR
ncbi:MAG: transposase [Acidobacteria bacterium]|nr:transposase [Acidobacteriota bacterium]